MEPKDQQQAIVWMLAETDDWDDLARLGVAHSHYATCEVVLVLEPNGWWDGEYTPYAVISQQQGLTYSEAAALVADAILNGTVRLAGDSHEPPQAGAETVNAYVDVYVDTEDLGSAIRAGMEHGRTYSTVQVFQTNTGAPVLRFGSDESDSGDDEDEMSRLIDRI